MSLNATKSLFELLRRATRLLPTAAKQALASTLLTDDRLVARYGFEFLAALAPQLKIKRISASGRYGTMSSSPDDLMIFPHYARYGVWEAGLDEQIPSFFPDGRGTYLDIGANIGMTLVPLARRYPAISCHAFEPEPSNYANLAVNVAENCISANITLHPIALHDRDGLHPMEIATGNLGNHRLRGLQVRSAETEESKHRLIDVTCKRLDDLSIDLQPPVVAKIDTQGAEPFIVSGGRRTLQQADAMFLEWSPACMAFTGADPELLLSFISENFLWGIIQDSGGASRKGHIKAVTSWLRGTIPSWVNTGQETDILVSKLFPNF